MPETALDKLKRLTAWRSVPKLTPDELQSLLDDFKQIDADGLLPTDPLWTPTYNLRAAARMGWKMKLGKASELQSTDLDGDRMSANQVFEHCKEMVKQFASNASPLTKNVAGT